jgi:hypothetical protein
MPHASEMEIVRFGWLSPLRPMAVALPLMALGFVSGLLPISDAAAQNVISAAGWQGFALRNPEGKFDRCVLYNRTIEALSASPYEMLGLTRNAAGKVGLMVFFDPKALQRGANVAVNLKVNGKPLAPLTGTAPSDFHVSVDGPIGRATLAALRQAKAIEATAENKTVQFQVDDLGSVLDELDACVKSNTVRIEPDTPPHEPGAPQPDASQPDAPQPDASQPDMAQPDMSQPDASQPYSRQNENAQ